MIYFVMPIIATLIITSGLWEKYIKDRKQEHLDVALGTTFSSLVACSATSFALWGHVNIKPVVHWFDTPWAWLLVPVIICISTVYHFWRDNRL